MSKRLSYPKLVLSLLLATLALVSVSCECKAPSSRPKLILQITVDQLRGDSPIQFRDRFGQGGFRYLMDQGVWYAAAEHPHAFLETIVGHTTLATGAYPAAHGMVANTWFDRATGQFQKNITDPQHPLIGTQTTGSSPVTILTTTLSDELSITTAGGAKIFAVSDKDRGAVPMAGHAGKAFWFSESGDQAGDFVTSTYYYDSYPEWVKAFNAQRKADAFDDGSWELLYERSSYVYAANDNHYPANSPPENAMEFLDTTGFDRKFPHHYGPKSSPFFATMLTLSPAIDELTLDFALELIEKEGLGTDDVPDYLGISFSANDIVGHWFGPSSVESEDLLLHLDRTLARLFAYVDRHIGLQNTLIVLSGDHGKPEFPEVLEKVGIDTGRISKDLVAETGAAALDERYGAGNGLLLAYQNPYFYLDRKKIHDQSLDQGEVERVVADAVMALDGIVLAVPASQLPRATDLDASDLLDQIRRNQHPERSGDVYVVPDAQWQLDDQPSSDVTVAGGPPVLLEHGSPWRYDTYVPVAFAGAGVPSAWITRQVYTTDVVPTIAAVLGTKFPSGTAGVPLPEVLNRE